MIWISPSAISIDPQDYKISWIAPLVASDRNTSERVLEDVINDNEMK